MLSDNNGHLFADERKDRILQLIETRDKISVPELVRQFNVSPATIRNDLRELEQLGLLRRIHGGALSMDVPTVGFEKGNEMKNQKFLNQKHSIAKKAMEFIEDGDVIVLDAGTTSIELARLIHKRSNITVVVNDLDIAECFEGVDGIQVLVIGGIVRKKFHCTVGPFATKILNELIVDKVFLSTNSFSLEKGCTTPDVSQAEIKHTMAKIASKVIVLCDSSKIGANSFVQFVPITEIDVLITDHHIEEHILQKLEESGIEIIVAKGS
ncbi:DeoR/GlpR family DNA-binding transcription regulator [Paenibacillus validus]|uniref:DeoR/GlpR family DNA-binding transcription regulator n=1 Tax=Paenibacillus TaxID=44249 RepID=UPI0013E09FCB|nr:MULTISPECIES: DeoR/GlpR family DNA-binding transcription regulator [Paenibacillus]MED4599224.1 DeoR/GlpR family DNA-binding transcription regulator [Paenibacillus validus]MED4606469.1 DeoR/GlpR family DNA-binding transcription regulator [Paenibacillus validus]